jgi:hypothetical protein
LRHGLMEASRASVRSFPQNGQDAFNIDARASIWDPSQNQRYLSVEGFGHGHPRSECPADISLCASRPLAGLVGVFVPLIILEAISLLSVRVSQDSFDEIKRQRGDWLYKSKFEMAAVSRAAPPR